MHAEKHVESERPSLAVLLFRQMLASTSDARIYPGRCSYSWLSFRFKYFHNQLMLDDVPAQGAFAAYLQLVLTAFNFPISVTHGAAFAPANKAAFALIAAHPSAPLLLMASSASRSLPLVHQEHGGAAPGWPQPQDVSL